MLRPVIDAIFMIFVKRFPVIAQDFPAEPLGNLYELGMALKFEPIHNLAILKKNEHMNSAYLN